MLKGDISNQSGVTIGFRCIDFLIKYKDTSFKDKLFNSIIGKVKRAEVEESVRSYMEHLYRNTEYNVDLIIERKDYTEDLKHLLDDLPFNRVVVIDKPSQITQRLLIGDLSLYVDDDDYRRSLVNNRYAIPLSELSQYIKRQGR